MAALRSRFRVACRTRTKSWLQENIKPLHCWGFTGNLSRNSAPHGQALKDPRGQSPNVSEPIRDGPALHERVGWRSIRWSHSMSDRINEPSCQKSEQAMTLLEPFQGWSSLRFYLLDMGCCMGDRIPVAAFCRARRHR